MDDVAGINVIVEGHTGSEATAEAWANGFIERFQADVEHDLDLKVTRVGSPKQREIEIDVQVSVKIKMD